MVIDIKMCRFDNVPWGFRLVGGADYEYPLTVVKVAEGSIAEEAGLCVEDVIVRINDTAATPLSHDEAHRLIMSSGSVFYFGVQREHEPEPEVSQAAPRRFPVSASSLTKSPTAEQSPTASGLASPLPLPSLAEATKAFSPEQERERDEVAQLEAHVEMPEMHKQQQQEEEQEQEQEQAQGHVGDSLYLPDLPDRPCSAMSERAEIKLVEEEIAAVLSGETQVLKEHNVMGVNFYRIFPKPGVCMTSDVLRSLNEEVTKTKLEKEKENRKWSTFLQRPDRPVPKSKQQLEAERRAANAYKVKIVKSAPRDKSPMPEAKPAEKEASPPSEQPVQEKEEKEEQLEEQLEEAEEEPLPTDSEVPNLEQLPDNGEVNNEEEKQEQEEEEEQLEKADASKEEQTTTTNGEQQTAPAEHQQQEETEETEAAVKSEEELALEKQLADVQKQLAALSSLPSTIQSTLDAVTKQLAELLPTFKLQQQQQQQQEQEPPQIEEEQPGEYEVLSNSAVGSGHQPATACENNENKCDDANDLEVAKISLSNGDNRQLEEQQLELEQEREEQELLNEELCFKKQKKHNVIEELEEHLVRKNNPRRSKRAFGPLVPSSERPLVLPGGRRWYRPKDAYNDEFIAETLSAQAELITGSTLGVNFMKYQKPERKIDLNRSEVYKVIHHLDRAPVRGIEVRAPLVAAESDIRQALQS